MDLSDDSDLQADSSETPASPADAQDQDTPQAQKALVAEVLKRIKDDKRHHEKAFKRMRSDMQVATWGADKTWIENGNYTAAIIARHIKMKTAALYAKNPKSVARRRETLDFAVWDENPQSLMLAYQTMQAGMQATQMAQAAGPMIGPGGMPMMPEPQMPVIPVFSASSAKPSSSDQ